MTSPETTSASAPLLVFDSGIGGLSVLKEIKRLLLLAPIIYAADHAGLPYGGKSEAEIAARVPALLGRLVERYHPRLVTIACNTACTVALPQVREALDVPVVGTVPAIKPASLKTKSGVIGLLGTEATIRQGYVDRLEAEFASGIRLLRHAAPGLVHAAETKMRGEAVNSNVYADAIAGLRQQPGGDEIDLIILGCTHFPLVQRELEQAAGQIEFIDGAAGIAQRVFDLSEGQPWPENQQPGIFVTTGDPAKIAPYLPMLKKFDLTSVEQL